MRLLHLNLIFYCYSALKIIDIAKAIFFNSIIRHSHSPFKLIAYAKSDDLVLSLNSDI